MGRVSDRVSILSHRRTLPFPSSLLLPTLPIVLVTKSTSGGSSLRDRSGETGETTHFTSVLTRKRGPCYEVLFTCRMRTGTQEGVTVSHLIGNCSSEVTGHKPYDTRFRRGVNLLSVGHVQEEGASGSTCLFGKSEGGRASVPRRRSVQEGTPAETLTEGSPPGGPSKARRGTGVGGRSRGVGGDTLPRQRRR